MANQPVVAQVLPGGGKVWAGDTLPTASTDGGPYEQGDYFWLTTITSGQPCVLMYKCTTRGGVGTSQAPVWVDVAQQQVVVERPLYGSAGSFNDFLLTREIFQAHGSESYQVIGLSERHSVLGSTTLQLVVARGSTPIGSGTNMVASASGAGVNIAGSGLDMTAAINIPQYAVFYNSAALLQIAPGDCIGLRPTNVGNLPPVGVVSIKLLRLL